MTSLRSLVLRSAALLPSALVNEAFRQWVGTLHVAMCLHRVNQGLRRRDEPLSALSISADKADELIERALLAHPGSPAPWLTVCFDDGYADAAEYVRERARRYPQVEWLLFVCPEKVEKQAGFRWDLLEYQQQAQRQDMLMGPMDLARENESPRLRALSRQARYQLVDVETCRELARLPNVHLGNHTNVHGNPMWMTADQAAEEYRRAHRDCERLFGPYEHFAFPFGTPEREFNAEHVAMMRRLSRCVLWSIEARPYAPEERRPGAVLPRFLLDGRRTVNELLLWVAAHALEYRLFGSPYAYPVSVKAAAA